jgi:hypothetical protein
MKLISSILTLSFFVFFCSLLALNKSYPAEFYTASESRGNTYTPPPQNNQSVNQNQNRTNPVTVNIYTPNTYTNSGNAYVNPVNPDVISIQSIQPPGTQLPAMPTNTDNLAGWSSTYASGNYGYPPDTNNAKYLAQPLNGAERIQSVEIDGLNQGIPPVTPIPEKMNLKPEYQAPSGGGISMPPQTAKPYTNKAAISSAPINTPIGLATHPVVNTVPLEPGENPNHEDLTDYYNNDIFPLTNTPKDYSQPERINANPPSYDSPSAYPENRTSAVTQNQNTYPAGMNTDLYPPRQDSKR